MKKIIITGSTGFVGSYLLEHLVSLKKYQIFGTYLTEESYKKLDYLKNNVSFKKLNLNSKEETEKLISEVKPDIIFHLAASTSPAQSFKKPLETITNNISSELNLLEAIRKEELFDTKILIISSAEIYGMVNRNELPISEKTSFKPGSPYAVSKIAQDFLGLQYNLSYNLPVIIARPFNHIGPRQAEGFVVTDFAKKIVEIEKNKREPILKVGNLEAKRDFTDVRDVVKVYLSLVEKGIPGQAYNIGSGVSYKISKILEILLSFSSAKIKVEIDKELFRPSDAPELVCDSTKLKNLTNWKPEIAIEKTLKDTLDYWRNII
ncbi:MAG TPA: GDP-mannose 4,6-dehydratase [Patescibacteria group bacterium]|nr:GDP-mannose 4,6-dehydratase [Patescibacteria group bacterium]